MNIDNFLFHGETLRKSFEENPRTVESVVNISKEFLANSGFQVDKGQPKTLHNAEVSIAGGKVLLFYYEPWNSVFVQFSHEDVVCGA